MRDEIVGSVRSLLLVLFGAVGLVLLIACANVANLQLVRAGTRRREFGIRLALGATQWRLTRQLIVESVLLTLLGGSIGLLLAVWGVELLIAAIPAAQLAVCLTCKDLRSTPACLDLPVGLSLLTGVVFGLAPGWRSSKADVQSSLKDSGNANARPHVTPFATG